MNVRSERCESDPSVHVAVQQCMTLTKLQRPAMQLCLAQRPWLWLPLAGLVLQHVWQLFLPVNARDWLIQGSEAPCSPRCAKRLLYCISDCCQRLIVACVQCLETASPACVSLFMSFRCRVESVCRVRPATDHVQARDKRVALILLVGG